MHDPMTPAPQITTCCGSDVDVNPSLVSAIAQQCPTLFLPLVKLIDFLAPTRFALRKANASRETGTKPRAVAADRWSVGIGILERFCFSIDLLLLWLGARVPYYLVLVRYSPGIDKWARDVWHMPRYRAYGQHTRKMLAVRFSFVVLRTASQFPSHADDVQMIRGGFWTVLQVKGRPQLPSIEDQFIS